jgi:hypothetical protein
VIGSPQPHDGPQHPRLAAAVETAVAIAPYFSFTACCISDMAQLMYPHTRIYVL